MDAPLCPVHQTPMSESTKRPGYFCPTKIGPGPRDYCTEKAPPAVARQARQPAAAPAAATQPAATSLAELRLRAAIAACHAAGTRYQGVGFTEDGYDGCPDLALRLYREILVPAMDGRL